MRRIGRTRARRALAPRLLGATAAFAGRRAVPLGIITGIRRISPERTPLPIMSRGSSSAVPSAAPLARLLDGIELGTWSLGPASIDELVRIVARLKPGAIVEFGSGVSTVALAWAIRAACGPSAIPRIISIEQDPEHGQRTRDLLARSGLEADCVIIVRPLIDQVIEGLDTTCYADLDGVGEALVGRLADLILVDGPAGAAGVRFGTLPLARGFWTDGATFVMDDALRDGELGIARRWDALPYVHVRGLQLIEKGLLTGTVTGG